MKHDDICVRIDKIMGKGEITVHQHFLLFPQCFQEASWFQSIKSGSVW